MASTSNANGSKVDIPMEELSAQLTAVKNDIAKLTHALGDVGKATADDVKATAAAKLETAQAKGAQGVAQVRNQAEDLHNQANEFVAKQPATALAIAAGAGFLLGFMSSRK